MNEFVFRKEKLLKSLYSPVAAAYIVPFVLCIYPLLPVFSAHCKWAEP